MTDWILGSNEREEEKTVGENGESSDRINTALANWQAEDQSDTPLDADVWKLFIRDTKLKGKFPLDFSRTGVHGYMMNVTKKKKKKKKSSKAVANVTSYVKPN